MRYYARNCTVKHVNKEATIAFVTTHHRDGCPRIADMKSFGLYHSDELVAVVVFGNPRTSAKTRRYSSELVRMAFKADVRIVGGASKMLKYAMVNGGLYDFFTYQDTTGEVTDVYELSGMSYVGIGRDKEYLVKNGYTLETANRKQKFGMAYVARFGPDRIIRTTFGQESGLTNKELFIQAGYHVETTTGDKVYEWFDPNRIKPINTQRVRAQIPTPIKGVNDLASQYPLLRLEWASKNVLDFDDMFVSSNLKVSWVCSHGHEWDAVINNRTNGSGCPVCSGRVVIMGETDFGVVKPDLLAEWHESNGEPEYSYGSTFNALWVCGICSHEYHATVTDRVGGNGCPMCAGKVVVPGVNDFATLYPNIAAEWSPTNITRPDAVKPFSSKKVTWVCKHGHEWDALISNRARGSKCPYCSGRKISPGFNDLLTLYPELASQLDAEQNLLSPSQVGVGNKRMNWSCGRCNHKWSAVIANRIKSSKCPNCKQ